MEPTTDKQDTDKLEIDGEILTDEEWDELAVVMDKEVDKYLDEFDLAVPEKFRGMVG